MKTLGARIKTILAAALLLAVCTLGSVSAYADEPAWPQGPEISSPNAIVMEANTGAVLYEKNADEQHYPASITKIMTTMLALENCPLDEVVTFSADAVYKNEGNTSHIARDVGEQMTLEQCLYGVMLESANECAYAVAEHVGGGSCQAFVDMMNERATELGCTGTHFNNPNGLPDETHVTTCRDMALISIEAIKNPAFRTITGTVRYTIPPTNKHSEETRLNNHHRMISQYKGSGYLYDYAIGGKTGYTVAAGSTLVTYAEKDGMLLVVVIMNSSATQYEDTRTLCDYCFSNFKLYNVGQNETRFEGTDASSDPLLFGNAEPFAELDTDANIILPASAVFSDTQTEVSYDQSGDNIVGTLVYSYGGHTVGTANVVTTGATVPEYEFGKKESGSTDIESSAVSESQTSRGGSIGESAKGFFSNFKKEFSDTFSELKDRFDTLTTMDKIIQLGIPAAIVIVVIILIILLIRRIRRAIRRRRRRRDRRYKVIHSSRKKSGRRRK